VSDPDLRQELEATLHARAETGGELEPQLVEGFVDKIEAEIERRAAARSMQRQQPRTHASVAVPLGSLGLAIPLLGVAGGVAGFPGVLLICVAIVLVNFFYFLSHR
jgi:hypothetical protein